MTRVVADASVAVKWVLEEAYSDAASRLLNGGYTLLMPELLYAEAANVFWKRVMRREFSEEEALTALDGVAAVPMQSYALLPLLPSALQIAMETGRTVYDSFYVALAVQQECQLVTADQRLFNALQGGPYAGRIVWVDDIS